MRKYLIYVIGIISMSSTLGFAQNIDPILNTVEIRIEDALDDAEEFESSKVVKLHSSDLEMVQNNTIRQLVGLRFNRLPINQGDMIHSAYLEFTVDEVSLGASVLTIEGQDTGDAPSFSNVSGDLSSRKRTEASVIWVPFPWSKEHASGFEQRSQDISAIVQEIVNKKTWSRDHAIAFLISGFGARTAIAWDRDPSQAPLLHITYEPKEFQHGIFMAYNDLSWGAGQLSQNITKITTSHGVGKRPYGSKGNLIDYRTGLFTPVTLSVTGGRWNGAKHAEFGELSESGTDAYALFNGFVDAKGVISYDATDLKLTLEGLDPALQYTLSIFGNRGVKEYQERKTTTSLSGAVSFLNASSLGSAFDDQHDPSTTIAHGYNTEQGLVARFDQVIPQAEGTVEVVLTDGGSPNPPSYYANVVYIEAKVPVQDSDLVVDLGVDQSIVYTEKTPLSAMVNVPSHLSNTLTSQWSQIRGPGTINFDSPSAFQTMALFPVSGVYTIRFTVFYGEGSTMFDDLEVTATTSSDTAFVSYNDFSWSEGQLLNNITRYTTSSGSGVLPEGASGNLLDYLSGDLLPARITVSGGRWNGGSHTRRGGELPVGSDAYTTFNDIVDTTGIISYGDTDLVCTIEGLDPLQRYTVVLYGDRGEPRFINRLTKTTLEGAVGFKNVSTPGADFSGPLDHSTVIPNGYNMDAGLVVRFQDVETGEDGSISLRQSGVGSPSPSRHYTSALLLMSQGEPRDLFPSIALIPYEQGFRRPVHLTHAGDGSGRKFIVEQEGIVSVIKDGTLSTFLDIRNKVRSYADPDGANEQGLFSIAFPPDFEVSQECYVDYTRASDAATIVSRYSIDLEDPNVLDDSSEEVLLTISQFARNHNGGQLGFSPLDGYLYISTGDGGGGGDPRDNGQELSSLLGKILRLDITSMTDGEIPYVIPSDNPFVDAPDARDEIWSYGLRNPWRFSFDPISADLFIGDVGQSKFEEVSLHPALDNTGLNFGWRCKEGLSLFNTTDCDLSNLVDPIWDYARTGGHCSVTGGMVYRGAPVWSKMYGTYIYADFCSGSIWGLKFKDEKWENKLLLDTSLRISSFGVDEEQNLYLIELNGGVFQVVESTP